MIQPKNKLTLVLTFYSVLIPLYKSYCLISSLKVYIEAEMLDAFFMINSAEMLISVAVGIILVWIIYTNKSSSALFLPVLILCILSVITLTVNIVTEINTPYFLDLLTSVPRDFLIAVIYLLIAIDSSRGSKFALAEATAIAIVTVIATIYSIIQFSQILVHFSSFSLKGLLLSILPTSAAGLVLSPDAVIFLLLLRTHILRKKAAALPPQPEQNPE